MPAVLSTLKCDKCGQVTTYNDSKTAGRGGTMRIDKVCADTTDAAELALLLPVAMSACKRTLRPQVERGDAVG